MRFDLEGFNKYLKQLIKDNEEGEHFDTYFTVCIKPENPDANDIEMIVEVRNVE